MGRETKAGRGGGLRRPASRERLRGLRQALAHARAARAANEPAKARTQASALAAILELPRSAPPEAQRCKSHRRHRPSEWPDHCDLQREPPRDHARRPKRKPPPALELSTQGALEQPKRSRQKRTAATRHPVSEMTARRSQAVLTDAGQPPPSGAVHLRMASATAAGNARERQRATRRSGPQHRRRTADASHRRRNIWRASPDGRSCTQVAHLVKIWYVCGMPTRDRVSATASTTQRRATMLAGPPCALRSHYGSLAHARRMSECVRRERMTFSLETRRSVRL